MIGKLKKLLLPAAVAAAAVCLLASCDQNGNIQTSLGLSPRTLTVQADGGSATISFSAAIEWTTTCNADWVTLSRTSGPAGDFSVTITVAANPSANSRTSSVTVTTMALSEQVVITQEGQPVIPDPELSLSSASAELGSNGGTVSLTVTANNEWRAASNGNWLKISPASGSAGSASVVLEAEANPSVEPREGKVTFTSANLEQVFTLTQAGMPAPIINLSSGSFIYPAGGGSYNLTVSANRDWRAAADASWVTLTPAQGVSGASTIVVAVSENSAYEERTATVNFTAEQETVSLVITQRAAEKPADAFVTLSSPSVNFPSDGGFSNLIVTASEEWTASVQQAAWLSVTPANGTKGATSIVILADENTAGEDRSAVIVFTTGNSRTELTVTQKGVPAQQDDPVLILSVTQLNFSAEAGSHNFSLTTNQDWTLDSQNTPWVHTDVSSGAAGTILVTVTVDANSAESERNGSIIVTAGNLRQSVLIIQAGVEKEPDPVIDLSSTAVNFTEEGGTVDVIVMADHEWSASGNADWLSYSPTSGQAGNTTIAITAQANSTTADRSAVITLSSGNTSVSISVSQKAHGQQSIGGITGGINDWGNGGEADFGKNN